MMSSIVLPGELSQEVSAAVDEACSRIAPLWPLQSFVAVNPFLGLSHLPFTDAAQLLAQVAHRTALMDAGYYLNLIENGSIQAEDVRSALESQGSPAALPADPLAWLSEQLKRTGATQRIFTVADWLDRAGGTDWAGFVTDEISKWCSSYFDRGQCAWKMPWADLPLYTAWKRAAAIDANPEVFGLPGFRKRIGELPETEDAAIEQALRLLNVPTGLTNSFLHRELLSVSGWSAYAAYHDRPGGRPRLVKQLLAIRLAYDTALLPLTDNWRCYGSHEQDPGGYTEAKYIAQLAAESAFRSKLARSLPAAPPARVDSSRKALQAIFCIDVRSEVYRRALEAQSDAIETIGFAGFFGMSVEYAASARCPVLIAPRHRVSAGAERRSSLHRWLGLASAAWKDLRNSASASFPGVEVSGAWFGMQMLEQTYRHANSLGQAPKLIWNIPLQERVELVAGALRNMRVDASRLAPLVLICGHGSLTENNPYASSLDCGACGGHKGDINARVAAALMNDPDVRQQLRHRGILIPPDTIFAAGLHVTTTDEVVVFDEGLLPESRRLALGEWLASASRQARTERARALLPGTVAKASDEVERAFRRRAADWSEVRPEWGLAGNAAFIAAPRWRTRGLDLGGRVFLHDYDASTDDDASVLELILTAPVVVASWINLQYYGSTVNNRLFGSGNKVLHNVVGTFGVWEGNGGDLRTGLPLQSLHDGAKWMHEPLRLQVFVEAPRDRIDLVLRANSHIRQLVENHWIHLMAIEDECIHERKGPAAWQAVPIPAVSVGSR